MKWFLVDKSASVQPSSGTYKNWKEDLRKEGREQCVYCAIREAHFGGFRNFHVEHYRPRKHFPSLENTITNLFYCCAICNSFKGSDWPGDLPEDLSEHGYPDPSLVDYSTIVIVDSRSHNVSGSCTAARYSIERLYLNRAQLVLLRRFVAIKSRLHQLVELAKPHLLSESVPALQKLGGMLAEAAMLALEADKAPPYEPADVTRN